MPKIVFVVPPVNTEEIWGELAEEGSILPPLGISILASLTRNNGFDTKIIDFLAEKNDFNSAVNRVLDENPDYLGITSTTDMVCSSIKFTQAIKKRNKAIITLLGGPHISAVPIETMKEFDCFDFGFIGESEDTLIEFLKAHKSKRDISDIKGLVIRKSGEVVYTGVQQSVADMDRIPLPAWDLLPDITRYYKPAVINYKREPVTSFVTSRGCVGQCIFCDTSVFGHRPRAFSSGYVIRAIEHLNREYGIKEICFRDENFVAFRRRLVEVCQNIIDKKLDISWSCNSRINLADPDTLRLMKKAGCWQISYGIESGSQRVLDILKKGINIQQIKDTIKRTREAGIYTKGYFMIANPTETKEDIQMTRRLMLEIGLNDMVLEYFTPYPGIPIYKEMENYGKFNSDWKNFNTFSVNFMPYGLTQSYLKRQFKLFYRDFYFRQRIIFEYIIRLGSFMKICALLTKFIKFLIAK